MAHTSVAQFASELKVPPSVLLEQLRAAGVDKRVPEDSLTDSDKSRLLEYLRKTHGSAESKNKITLTRKQTSEIRKTDASGKYRTVQVEVRKKRVFVKRDPAEVAAAAVAAEAPPPPPPTVDAKEIELREEEAKRVQEAGRVAQASGRGSTRALRQGLRPARRREGGRRVGEASREAIGVSRMNRLPLGGGRTTRTRECAHPFAAYDPAQSADRGPCGSAVRPAWRNDTKRGLVPYA